MNLASHAEGFLRLKDVRSVTGLARTTIYRQISTGDFPRPYRLGSNAVGWKRSEIENWVQSRTKTHA